MGRSYYKAYCDVESDCLTICSNYEYTYVKGKDIAWVYERDYKTNGNYYISIIAYDKDKKRYVLPVSNHAEAIELIETIRYIAPGAVYGYSGYNQATYGHKGCYIATSVYGTYDCNELWTLRRYRDQILERRWYGRAFIQAYYTISPILIRRLGNDPRFNRFWKVRLDKIVRHLQEKGMDNSPYMD